MEALHLCGKTARRWNNTFLDMNQIAFTDVKEN